jgi:ubiquitin C-terminal hydrolase
LTQDLQTCLQNHFTEHFVKDYRHRDRTVRAYHQQLLSKLPNVLCIHFKRFVWAVDRPVKLSEKVRFDDVISIKPEWLASNLDGGSTRRYRLYSVVEHVGERVDRGHYVCCAMDADNTWQHFDDVKVSERDLSSVLHQSQAYVLFYELIY